MPSNNYHNIDHFSCVDVATSETTAVAVAAGGGGGVVGPAVAAADDDLIDVAGAMEEVPAVRLLSDCQWSVEHVSQIP